MDQAQLKRIETIRNFVANLNSQFIPSKTQTQIDIHRYLVSDPIIIKYWIPVFTHITANPSNGKNYEMLEYLGDSVLDGAFDELLVSKMPVGSESTFTNIHNIYTGNEYLSKVCEELKLDTLLDIKGARDISYYIKADLVEAYVGALYSAGNEIRIGNVPAFGFGYTLVLFFVKYVFGEIDFTTQDGRGAPETNVEQYFTRFGLKTPKIETRTEGKIIISEIYLSDEQIAFLAAAGVKISTGSDKLLIGVGKSREKKISKSKAFEDAYEYLDKLGVNPKWAEDLKNKKEMSSVPPDVFNKALIKASKVGYATMFFYMPNKTSNVDGFVMMLVGVFPDGTRDTLLAKYYEYNDRKSTTSELTAARIDVITEYANTP